MKCKWFSIFAIIELVIILVLLSTVANRNPVALEGETAIPIDVLAHPVQPDLGTPHVVEIPKLEGEAPDYQEDAKDLGVMFDYLISRLSSAGVELSDSAMLRVCEELGHENWVYSCGYTWMQHGDFGLLILKKPTAEGQADTCYVFEDNRYKGVIDPSGGFDLEDCIVTLEDDVWLTAYSRGSGSGFGQEDRFWYRLTSRDLRCEFQYMANQVVYYWPDGEHCAYYDEKIIEIASDDDSEGAIVTTSSVFTLQDTSDNNYTYQFKHEDTHTYYLGTWFANIDTRELLEDEHEAILLENQEAIRTLLEEGTTAQKMSLRSVIKSWRVNEWLTEAAEHSEVYQRYVDWYDDYIPPKDNDTTLPSYTRSDYDEMRKSLPYEPFEVDYSAAQVGSGYLEIDETAGRLEEYVGQALMGLLEPREVPNVLADNDLIFQTAGFCTNGFSSDENALIKNTGAWYSATPKEHLDLTAKYLFGNECVIDYEELADQYKELGESKHIAYYGYAEEFGLALRYNVKKEGLVPTVIDYKDMGSYYQATVVLLTWSGWVPPEYDLCYYNEATSDAENQYIYLNKENAKEFCYSETPDQYRLRIDKGEGGRLYLRSVLQN
jgi:hypothetical protein